MKASLRGHDFATQVQMLAPENSAHTPDKVQAAAARGIAGSGGGLPHGDRIQRSFGGYDLSNVQAHSDATANDATAAMGAAAYATGNHVVLGQGGQDLHTVAHEAAHVVQQRHGVSLSGGVGTTGDPYEQHADAVADLVVQGKSAEGLLGQMAGGGGVGTSAVQLERAKEPDSVAATRQAAGAGSSVAPLTAATEHHPPLGEARSGAAFHLGTSGMKPYDVIQDVAARVVGAVSDHLSKMSLAIAQFMDQHVLHSDSMDGHLLWTGIGAVASTVLNGFLAKFPVIQNIVDIAGKFLEGTAEVKQAKEKEKLLAFATSMRSDWAEAITKKSDLLGALKNGFRLRFEQLGKGSPNPFTLGALWVEGPQGQYLHTLMNTARDAEHSERAVSLGSLVKKLHESWISSQTRRAKGAGDVNFREVLSSGYLRITFETSVAREPGSETPQAVSDVRCIGATLVASGADASLAALKELVVPWNIWSIEVPKRIAIYERSGGSPTPMVDVELDSKGNLIRLVDRHRLHGRFGGLWLSAHVPFAAVEAKGT